MTISTKQKERHLAKNDEKCSLTIKDEQIDNVLTAKYLGIQVDRNWKGHIKTLSSKISRAIGFVKHAKSFLTHGNCFCTIGSDLADKIQPAANSLLSGEYEVNKDKANFGFKTIELTDIRDAFPKVKTTKSFGVNNISSYFLKFALPYTVNSLNFLFNTSIETNQFPDSWKVARTTSIFKDRHRTDKSNYRPIPVLSVISKLVEKFVFNQLYQMT